MPATTTGNPMAGKNHKVVIGWFIISGLIAFTAVRQIQISVTSETQARKPLPPPAKTRHAVRPLPQPWTGDPLADYSARCGKGLTDREIGWIIEDFKNTGLAFPSFTPDSGDEVYLAYRLPQNRWYHAALVDGLRLTPEQAAQASAGLRERFEKLRAAFQRDRQEVENRIHAQLRVERFNQILSPYWLMGAEDWQIPDYSTFLPWDLCQLTPQQERMTWKKEILAMGESTASLEVSEHPLFRNNAPLANSTDIPGPWDLVDTVFPFTKSQALDFEGIYQDKSGAIHLANVRKLHPAQFKLLLLLSFNLAEVIQKALENHAR